MHTTFAERNKRTEPLEQRGGRRGGGAPLPPVAVAGVLGLTAVANRILKLRPRNVRKLLKKHGHKSIKKIVVCRVPINSVVKGILNALTLGGLSKAQKRLSYDEVYHLYANIFLDDGTVIGLEKNQRVRIVKGGIFPKKQTFVSKAFEQVMDTNKCRVASDLSINLKEFFRKAEAKAGGNLWQYSGYRYNCQHFINTLLTQSGVTHLTPFIMQDAGQLIKNSFVRKIAKFTTDVAGVAEFGVRGGALEY